jgi:UDP-N-acetylglucosamine:LPS N-acetylglucosamine transferase
MQAKDGKNTKTALICWELGGGLGHISPIIELAKQLIDKHYRIIIAAKDLKHQSLLQHQQITWLQAPQLPTVPVYQSPSCCFAETLLRLGYDDPAKISDSVKAWLSLYQRIQPDLTFFDFSPSAQLAFYNKSCEKILIGSTFTDPVNHENICGLYDANKPDAAKKLQSQIIVNINQACLDNKIHSLQKLSDLYTNLKGRIYFTIEELDHFQNRLSSEKQFFVGNIGMQSTNIPSWPKTPHVQKKVFAYIALDKFSNTLIQGLVQSNQSCLICVKSDFEIPNILPDNIQIIDKTVNIESIKSDCDLIITNASANIATEISMSGIPHLVWPTMLEQKLLSDSLIAKKLARLLDCTMPERVAVQVNRELKKKSVIRETVKEKYQDFKSINKLQAALTQLGV